MFLGQAIILGLIQGFTEFLPVSSSGHLIILPVLFQWPDHGLTFDAFLHLGTLLAVLIYFRKEIFYIISSFFSKDNKEKTSWRRLGIYIIIATIPAAVVGLVVRDAEVWFRSTTVVAVSLIVWAIVMLLAEEYSKKVSNDYKLIQDTNFIQAITIGFWQIIALIPGTSRSGITMSGAMLAGMNKKVAVKFSFLLSLPVIAAAGGLSLFELIKSPSQIGVDWQFAATGFIAAAVSGYLAIAIMLKFVEKWGFKPFVAYRIILALALLFFL